MAKRRGEGGWNGIFQESLPLMRKNMKYVSDFSLSVAILNRLHWQVKRFHFARTQECHLSCDADSFLIFWHISVSNRYSFIYFLVLIKKWYLKIFQSNIREFCHCTESFVFFPQNFVGKRCYCKKIYCIKLNIIFYAEISLWKRKKLCRRNLWLRLVFLQTFLLKLFQWQTNLINMRKLYKKR